MWVDVVETEIVGREIAFAASCSGSNTRRGFTPACLPHRRGRMECLCGCPERDDVLEMKEDSFSTVI